MVKHIIMWQLKDELTGEEKVAVKKEIKSGLEGLKGQIHGLLDIDVQIDRLPTSNAEVMLNSTFSDQAALEVYAHHPKHLAVADGKIRPFTKTRMCMDYEV